jgi:methionyl-tRNA formyltransferase
MVLRIGYFAHGPWAHQALARILADPESEVRFVATRNVGDAVLESMARSAGLPFLIPGNVNEAAEMTRLSGYGADLFVSMSFDQIFRRPLLDLPPMGVINCHAGALPFYRGRNILNWALINGESRFGVTVIYMDEGIDTGPILQQDFVDISPDDSYGDLLEKAYTQCADTLHAALVRVRNGVQPIPQSSIHPRGFYCGQRRDGDEWLDWRDSSADVHNFVRSISLPGPCARTRHGDRVYAIVQTELIADAVVYRGTSGEVVGRVANGIDVKTGDSVIRVLKVAELDSASHLGPVMTASLPVGTRFYPWMDHRLEQLETRVKELELLIRQKAN